MSSVNVNLTVAKLWHKQVESNNYLDHVPTDMCTQDNNSSVDVYDPYSLCHTPYLVRIYK